MFELGSSCCWLSPSAESAPPPPNEPCASITPIRRCCTTAAVRCGLGSPARCCWLRSWEASRDWDRSPCSISVTDPVELMDCGGTNWGSWPGLFSKAAAFKGGMVRSGLRLSSPGSFGGNGVSNRRRVEPRLVNVVSAAEKVHCFLMMGPVG